LHSRGPLGPGTLALGPGTLALGPSTGTRKASPSPKLLNRRPNTLQGFQNSSGIYILKMPNFVLSMGALRAAERERPRTRLESAGSITPSSQRRAEEK